VVDQLADLHGISERQQALDGAVDRHFHDVLAANERQRLAVYCSQLKMKLMDMEDMLPFRGNLGGDVLKVLRKHHALPDSPRLRKRFEDSFDDQPAGHPLKDLAFNQTVHVGTVP